MAYTFNEALKVAALFAAPARDHSALVLQAVRVRRDSVVATDRYGLVRVAHDAEVTGDDFSLAMDDVKRIGADKTAVTAIEHNNGRVTVTYADGRRAEMLAWDRGEYPRLDHLIPPADDVEGATLVQIAPHQLARLSKLDPGRRHKGRGVALTVPRSVGKPMRFDLGDDVMGAIMQVRQVS